MCVYACVYLFDFIKLGSFAGGNLMLNNAVPGNQINVDDSSKQNSLVIIVNLCELVSTTWMFHTIHCAQYAALVTGVLLFKAAFPQ